MNLLAWLSAALAVLPLLIAAANLRRFKPPRPPAFAETRVSILIPARNEAATIEAAVRGALANTGVQIEVLVLDDDSADTTAEIVARLAAADDRVRLCKAPPLPPGWAGKQRACHLLSEQARFEVLMFVDADVQLAPAAAARAAGFLLNEATLGMVSGFPRELTASLAERLVIPWIHVLLLGYLPMDRMRASTSPAYAAACGQWVVARANAYRQVGGHAAAPASRHDGTSLPRTFRAAGWRTDVFDGSGLAQCRMYTDLPSVWHGFAKSAGEGMATPTALPVWTLLIGAGHVLPALWLVIGLAAALSGLGLSGDAFSGAAFLGAAFVGTAFPGIALAGGIGLAANWALRFMLCARFEQSWLSGWLHPVGAVLVLAIQWLSLLGHLRGRPSEWRGRRYLRQPR